MPDAESLLDVGCGTGGHLAHLRGRFTVVGIDLDAQMLAQARARLPDVELVEADMRSFQRDRTFDVVACLFSSIGYMASQQASSTSSTATSSRCSATPTTPAFDRARLNPVVTTSPYPDRSRIIGQFSQRTAGAVQA